MCILSCWCESKKHQVESWVGVNMRVHLSYPQSRVLFSYMNIQFHYSASVNLKRPNTMYWSYRSWHLLLFLMFRFELIVSNGHLPLRGEEGMHANGALLSASFKSNTLYPFIPSPTWFYSGLKAPLAAQYLWLLFTHITNAILRSPLRDTQLKMSVKYSFRLTCN